MGKKTVLIANQIVIRRRDHRLPQFVSQFFTHKATGNDNLCIFPHRTKFLEHFVAIGASNT